MLCSIAELSGDDIVQFVGPSHTRAMVQFNARRFPCHMPI